MHEAKAVGRIDTRAGTVSIWRVYPTYEGAATEVVGYVSAVDDPHRRYEGARLAMCVTVHDSTYDLWKAKRLREAPNPIPEGKWDGEAIVIDNLYAVNAFRGSALGTPSPPVEAGVFLREHGYFTKHSSTRSVGGEKWAEAVGGEAPDLLGRPTGDLETHMRGWLDAPNDGSAVPDVT